MTSKIYKYFSSNVLRLVFDREGKCGVKCSFPKDYNDPFELFLGVDLSVGTEQLATYQEIVQDLPQFPTTCFSGSPVVSPMWAHYGAKHSGFVLEFDVAELKENFPQSVIDQVDYRDKPDPGIAISLQMARGTKKPRHALFLRQAVFSGAYFSKSTEWTYEEEFRFVDTNQYTENIAGNDILFVPIDCVSSIVVGSNSSPDHVALSQEIARDNGLDWYKLHIGRSNPRPFFVRLDDEKCVFEGGAIIPAINTCGSCSEPLSSDNELCPWCGITEDHQLEAATGNPFRILDHFGLLGDYLREAGKIGRKRR